MHIKHKEQVTQGNTSWTNTLDNGVYFLNAYSGTNVKTIRFIVTDN